MPISQLITYNEVITLVKNWLKSNCKNITDYNSIKSEFKSGWSKQETVLSAHGGDVHYTGIATISIKSGAIEQATAETVDNDMSLYITNNCKLSTMDLDKNISESEFYNFIQNMISFICSKCAYATSQFSQNTKYLIYVSTNNNYMETFSIDLIDEKKIINALDVTSLMKTMFDVVNQNMRCHHIIYQWSISGV